MGGFTALVCLGRRMREYFRFLGASQLYFTALLNEVSNYPGCWLQNSAAQAKPKDRGMQKKYGCKVQDKLLTIFY